MSFFFKLVVVGTNNAAHNIAEVDGLFPFTIFRVSFNFVQLCTGKKMSVLPWQP